MVNLALGQLLSSFTNYSNEIMYLCLISLALSLAILLLLQLFSYIMITLVTLLAVLGGIAITAFYWYNYAVVVGAVNESKVATSLQPLMQYVRLFRSSSAGNETINATVLLDTFAVSALRGTSYLLPVAISVTIATVIIMLVLLWTRKSVHLVIILFGEASLSVYNMPGLLLQPFLTLLFVLGATVYFLYIGTYIASVQIPKVDNDGMVQYIEDYRMPRILLFFPHFLGWFWMMQFISGCHQVVIAESVSHWFFRRGEKNERCHYTVFPTLRPMRNLILYNLGSVALGSLVITVVRAISVVLAFLQRKLQGKTNKVVVCLLKCISCCLACFEKVLKYISRNAYICVAMYGDGFCAGARHAFGLLVSNAQHVFALNYVGGFFLLLGKLAVAVLVGFIGSAWFRAKLGEDATFDMYVAPILIACIFSLIISICFFSIYGMAVDTIFLCFCDDQQRNDGETRPYYSSVRLLKCLSGKAAASRRKTILRNSKQSKRRSDDAESGERASLRPKRLVRLGSADASRTSERGSADATINSWQASDAGGSRASSKRNSDESKRVSWDGNPE